MPPVTRTTAIFAWQGWRLELSAGWNPVKLEGDYENGHALIADMDRAQLGVRWRSAGGRRFDAVAWAARALRDEVGTLAAQKAEPVEVDCDAWAGATAFTDPDPPGRDVFVAHSRASGRVVEIVHHVRRRSDRGLVDAIVPSLVDSPPDQPTTWRVFDLSCTVPVGYRLATHRLNAGDLTLSFVSNRRVLTVRQIALAELALRGRTIENWLALQERSSRKLYKPVGDIEPAAIDSLTGVARLSRRRRRYFFLRRTPATLRTHALRDTSRDRLLLVQSGDDATAHEVARSMAGG